MCYLDGLATTATILLLYEALWIIYGTNSFTYFFKKMRQDKKFRTFIWTLFNAVIALGLGYITDSQYAALLVPVLNEITKYINITYFGDIGVK